MKKIVQIVLFLAFMANAANVVAVLEITPSGDDATLTIQEYRHLTDELRARAREALPSGYSVLTRDNILSLIPTDEKEAECLAESCAVEIGRAIGAEYVTQGSIGKFDGMFTLTVELYESLSGNMLGSFVTESDNVRGLLGTIREKAPALFTKIIEKNKTPDKIPTNIPAEPRKSGNSFWVAVGLDVLGAAIIGFAVYENSEVDSAYDRYKIRGNTTDYYDTMWKDVESSQKTRNVLYVVGGLVLASGIGVHIWF